MVIVQPLATILALPEIFEPDPTLLALKETATGIC